MKFATKWHRVLFVVGCMLVCFAGCMVMSGCAAPAWLTELEQIPLVAGSALAGILSILGSFTGNAELTEVSALISGLVNKVQASIGVVNEGISEYKGSPSDSTLTKIEDALTDALSNLQQLLTVDGLPAAQAQQITTLSQALYEQLQAMLTLLPVFKTSTAGQSLAVLKPISAADFHAKIATALKA